MIKYNRCQNKKTAEEETRLKTLRQLSVLIKLSKYTRFIVVLFTLITVSLHKIIFCGYLMCNFYSLIMVFPVYPLFYLIVGKLFSLQNLALSLS